VAAHDLEVEAGKRRGIGAGADHGADALATRHQLAAEVVAHMSVGARHEGRLHRILLGSLFGQSVIRAIRVKKTTPSGAPRPRAVRRWCAGSRSEPAARAPGAPRACRA